MLWREVVRWLHESVLYQSWVGRWRRELSPYMLLNRVGQMVRRTTVVLQQNIELRTRPGGVKKRNRKKKIQWFDDSNEKFLKTGKIVQKLFLENQEKGSTQKKKTQNTLSFHNACKSKNGLLYVLRIGKHEEFFKNWTEHSERLRKSSEKSKLKQKTLMVSANPKGLAEKTTKIMTGLNWTVLVGRTWRTRGNG